MTTTRPLISVDELNVDPHEKLWCWVQRIWPDAVREYRVPIPGRKFRADIAFPALKLVLEVDGYASHAKRYSGFEMDRRRQNLFVVNGWRVLRFPALDVLRDLQRCITTIQTARVTSPGYREYQAAQAAAPGPTPGASPPLP
ncbi:endonuclease domain-containing protein [Thiomonas sp.]